MKTIYAIAAAIAMTASPAIAKPVCNAACLIKKLPNTAVKQAINEVNNEDQRVVDGTFNAATGVLTLYTQDMVAGADGDISPVPLRSRALRRCKAHRARTVSTPTPLQSTASVGKPAQTEPQATCKPEHPSQANGRVQWA